jgi:hypothetical protein
MDALNGCVEWMREPIGLDRSPKLQNLSVKRFLGKTPETSVPYGFCCL